MNGSAPDPYAASPKLAALSPDELAQLMKRYEAGEKAPALIKEFGLRIAASELVMCFPPLVHPDHVCPYCGIPMVSRRPSQTQPSFYSHVLPIFCPQCHHWDSDNCQCEHCQNMRENKRRQEEARKRRLIRKTFPFPDDNPRELSSLSLRERVLLGALLRTGLTGDYSRIKPLCEQKIKLSPREVYDSEIVDSLCRTGVIAIHPKSPIAAFTGDADDPFPRLFYPNRVSYYVNIRARFGSKDLLEFLIQPPKRAFDSCLKFERHELWKEIAFEECMEYLIYRLSLVNFPFAAGERTRSVFLDLLDHFATAQIFCFIGTAIGNAVARAREKTLSKKLAANSVVTDCQRQGVDALANHGDVATYPRDCKCPQSTLSSLFYDQVLKIGDRGLDFCPHQFLESKQQ